MMKRFLTLALFLVVLVAGAVAFDVADLDDTDVEHAVDTLLEDIEEADKASGLADAYDHFDDEEYDDEEEEDLVKVKAPFESGDILVSSGAKLVEKSPCGCKGRVKDPSDEYPYDVKCHCEIEKPDPGHLPSLEVTGQSRLNGLAYLGYCPFTSNLGAPMQNGFYQVKGNKPGQIPDRTHPWTHLINARHSNKATNHQLQIASSYKTNDRLFFRKIATSLKSDNPEWNEVAVRSGRNTFQGTQTVQMHPVEGNGNSVGLEFYVDDANPPKVASQHPSIRFHHAYRYWHRLEGRRTGLHVKVGQQQSDHYSAIYASHFRSVSDAKAKRNIRTMENALSKIRNVKAYQYEVLSHGYDHKEITTPSVGLIAQDLLVSLPEAVHEEEATGQKFVDYNALTATNVQALRELADQTENERDFLLQKIDTLHETVKSLQKQVDELRSKQ